MARTSKKKAARPKNSCFACGPDNPDGLHLVFAYDHSTQSVECRLRLPARCQGATGFAHGGMIALLLDEAMAKVNGLGGIRAMTVRLQTNYRRVVPVEREIVLTGWRTRKRGRKLYLRAQIHGEGGELLAEGRGLFLSVPSS